MGARIVNEKDIHVLKISRGVDTSRTINYIVNNAKWDNIIGSVTYKQIQIPITEDELWMSRSICDGLIANNLIEFRIMDNGEKVASLKVLKEENLI